MTDVWPHQPLMTFEAGWLTTLRRYFAFSVPAHFIWEIVQLPLYTIWNEAPLGQIIFAVVHCTGGDALIAAVSLLGALLLFGDPRWPTERFTAVAAMTVLAGVAYTIFSEWHNTEVRNSWAYSSLMPTLPGIGTGLSPFLQWLVIPSAAFWWTRRRHTVRTNPAKES